MRLENLRIWFGDRAARHEGSLRGKWYSFPLDEEKTREDFGKGLRKIQLFASEEFPPELCSKYYSIAELNSIYQSLKALDPVLLEHLAELMAAGYDLEDIERIGSDFYYYEGCHSMAEVAEKKIMGSSLDVSDLLPEFLDFERMGFLFKTEGNFVVCENGVLELY